jgi:hypothetical protein
VKKIFIYGICLLFCLPVRMCAQHVLYAESFHSGSSSALQVVGKSGKFYWVEKIQRQKSTSHSFKSGPNDILSFELLDSKLNLLMEFPATRLTGTLKQWLICGKEGLDQLVITREGQTVKIIRSGFQTNGLAKEMPRVLDSLPYSMDASGMLLVRSEDQSKILIVGFENTDDDETRMHALLFHSDWTPIYHRIILHESFSQPCIQDEEIGFPSESFDNQPIKLANNGEWLMAAPSRVSLNFSVFHANSDGTRYNFREIPVNPFYKMEDIAMSIDNIRQEMNVGLLSSYLNTSLKNVQVCRYSMKPGKFDFDSSFRFNTQYHDIVHKHLSHESFVSVPGAGFLLMIEYGTPFDFQKPDVPVFNNWEAAYLLSNYTEPARENALLKDGYTGHIGLTPISSIRNRGDLNLFYFPAISKDSAWSGVLDLEQHNDLNNPDLSYLLIPAGDKFYMIYNRFNDSEDGITASTAFNIHGQPNEEPFVFWGPDRTLNFQNARRFATDEVSVPYLNQQQSGFALIRLQ